MKALQLVVHGPKPDGICNPVSFRTCNPVRPGECWNDELQGMETMKAIDCYHKWVVFERQI
ncbi:MAG: hypothetical protein DRI57_03865 [Deltaproteobacteria bacterium]|nr:MAG: hypothetical protein DRI57_03865 [Deltaproteobacteria bacterium]